MKKLASLSIILALFSFGHAFAEDMNENLVPDTTLEEMMDAGVADEGMSIDSFEFDHGHRFVTCVARNRRGQRFQARGVNPREAQMRALHQCRQVSRQCFALGCHRG